MKLEFSQFMNSFGLTFKGIFIVGVALKFEFYFRTPRKISYCNCCDKFVLATIEM